MALRVKNVAHLVGNEIVITGQPPRDFAALLTSIETTEPDGPEWELSVVIGEGTTARLVKVTLSRFVSNAQFQKSFHEPIKFMSHGAVLFVLFRSRFFHLGAQTNKRLRV